MTLLTEPPVPQPRRRVWIPLVIVAASLVLLAAFVGVIALVATLLSARFSAGAAHDELVAGERSSALAVSPTECETACFTADAIPLLQPTPDALAERDLTVESFPWGTYDPTTAGQVHRESMAGWVNSGAGPDACFFVPTNAPVGITDLDNSDDEIQWIGTNSSADRANIVDQSVRFFTNSAGAVDYLEQLQRQIDDCSYISMGSEQDFYEAEVSPSPALNVPDSVAAVGWVRTGDQGPRWRAYTIDLQRGNLVVRTRVLTDGSLSETSFRALVVDIAEQLDAIESSELPWESLPPVEGAPSSPFAVTPTECVDDCFGFVSLNLSSPSKTELDALGLVRENELIEWTAPTLAEQHEADDASWAAAGAVPPACQAVWSSAPVTSSLTSEITPDVGKIYLDGSHTSASGASTFEQSVRLFGDSASAVDYMERIRGQAAACNAYVFTRSGTKINATVTMAAALGVPDSVAVTGWTQKSDAGDTYVFDLQRGNYVVRTVLATRGEITELQFRDLMRGIASRVSAMEFE